MAAGETPSPGTRSGTTGHLGPPPPGPGPCPLLPAGGSRGPRAGAAGGRGRRGGGAARRRRASRPVSQGEGGSSPGSRRVPGLAGLPGSAGPLQLPSGKPAACQRLVVPAFPGRVPNRELPPGRPAGTRRCSESGMVGWGVGGGRPVPPESRLPRRGWGPAPEA